MPKSLDVYLQSDLVGYLSQDTSGQMHFQYIESWLDGYGAAPLSQSLALRKECFSQKECRGYFGGILPEASGSTSQFLKEKSCEFSRSEVSVLRAAINIACGRR